MSAAPEKRPGTGAFVLAFTSIYVIWGSTYLGIRIAVETMPPFAMAAVRFLIAGAILYAIVRLRGAPAATARQWRGNAIIGTFLLLGGNGLVAWAEQYVPSAITALIIGVSPMFMVLTEWAWPGGHRPTSGTFVGLALGFAGVTWLAAPWESASSGGVYGPGLVALMSACILWSVGAIYTRHFKNQAEPFLASALQMLGGGAALTLTALFHGDFAALDLGAVSARSWIAFIYLTIFGSLVGFSTFVWLMKHTTPARTATYAYVNPVVAVFLGWLILDEPITSRTLLSAALIVAAVAIITTRTSAAKAKA